MKKRYTIYKTDSRMPKFRKRIYTDTYEGKDCSYVCIEDGTPDLRLTFLKRWVKE